MANVLRFSFRNFNGIEKGNDKFKDLMIRSCEITDYIMVKDRTYMLFTTYTRDDKDYDYIISIVNEHGMLSKDDITFLTDNESDLITTCKNYIELMNHTSNKRSE